MDPLSRTLIDALDRGADGSDDPALTAAYHRLRDLLTETHGPDSDILDALERLEKRRDSAGRRQTLEEEIQTAGASADPAVAEARRVLDDLLDS